jgi:hypothetical protein
MKKRIFFTGLIIFIVSFIIAFLAGAVLPGDVTIPFIYGSNQIGWMALSLAGLIIAIIGLIKKSKVNRIKKKKK